MKKDTVLHTCNVESLEGRPVLLEVREHGDEPPCAVVRA
jgi:hypothetical protein